MSRFGPLQLRLVCALLLAGAAAGCAATVPLEEHQALESQLAELARGQEELRGEFDVLELHNQRLTAMVAAQRQIIRDLRCNPTVDIAPVPDAGPGPEGE
jgi:hypothetical protein